MNAQRWIAWLVFTVWLVWLHALHAWLARDGWSWAPDLGLVFVFSVLARLEAKELPWLLACALVARAALAVEPATALGAGLTGMALAVLAARGMLELTAPAWRTLCCAAAVFAFDAWLVLVARVRGSGGEPFASALVGLVPVAISTGLVSLALGPALAHLPGLTPLRSRKW